MIDNPVINTPYEQPSRYFEIADGDLRDIVPGRRPSENLLPVPPPKKRGPVQDSFLSEKVVANDYINRVRERVALWRRGRYEGTTRITRQLLDYWANPDRENKLFWCQIEAVETAIFLTEVAHKRESADRRLVEELRAANHEMNPTLLRIAFKMATGSGKTVVMAMLIAWQALNKLANPRSPRFSSDFLLVAPGITIRDRLQVLQPNHPDNYYKKRDILPPDLLGRLQTANIEIINYHRLMLKKDPNAPPRLAQELLNPDDKPDPFLETPAQMVSRVCAPFGNRRELIVINDEAHHCYRPRPDEAKLSRDEKQEAERQGEEARVWLAGLEAIAAELGVKAVYDLSATPSFLKGSGYPEGSIFPWVVSDFSLLDAIEAGIVKVPRVPVQDNAAGNDDLPMYRDLWQRIRDKLPSKGRKELDYVGEPPVPKELQAAVQQLYSHYAETYREWEQDLQARAAGQTPPVFIVVCNNTAVSKLVYDWLSGWEKTGPDGEPMLVEPPVTKLFSNIESGRWRPYPNTILVDSEQLESGEAMSSDFKTFAGEEIETFKQEYRRRNPGADVEKITDEDLLREVMNTVGKPGKLGEQIRCVVSVSMLTEGWDCGTVTHIMGVRAFGTQLLCEQVVGRALRRINYAPDDGGMFPPEYADVLGVPFRVMLPTTGKNRGRGTKFVTHVHAMPERAGYEIRYPHVIGYRWEMPDGPLNAKFDSRHKLTLSTKDVATMTLNASIFGQEQELNLDDLQERRLPEVDFLLAKLVLEKYFRLEGGEEPDGAESETDTGETKPRFRADVQTWRFPELLRIVRQWREECLVKTDDSFDQLLLLIEYAHDAAERIHQGIQTAEERQKILRPILRPFDPEGSTAEVDFETTRTFVDTRKSHVNRVTMDSGWEGQLAQKLESMDEVYCYVKNERMGFKIPYTIGFKERDYIPDFVALIDDGHGPNDLLRLVIEVSGERRSDKEAKVATARNYWVPAVNSLKKYGRWAFVEISNPETAKQELRNFIKHGETRPMMIALFDNDPDSEVQ